MMVAALSNQFGFGHALPRRNVMSVVGALFLLFALPALGQNGTAPDDSQSEMSFKMSKEDIQARLAQIEAATDIPETAKTELSAVYRQALDQMAATANWAAKSAEYQKGREAGPQLLEAAKSQLAARPSGAAPAQTLEIPSDATPADFQAKLAVAEEALKAAQAKVKELDDETQNRAARRTALPDLIADANKRLEAVGKDASALAQSTQAAQLVTARQTLLSAQKAAIEEELRAYDEELRFYTARSDLLSARRELAKLAADDAKALVARWQETVSAVRQRELNQQKRQAARELSKSLPSLLDIAKQNTFLVDERTNLSTQLQRVQDQLKINKSVGDDLAKDLQWFRDNLDVEGLGDVFGPELRKKRNELRTLEGTTLELREYRKELDRARLRLDKIGDAQLGLSDLDRAVEGRMPGILEQRPDLDVEAVKGNMRELLETQRDLLNRLKQDYETYFDGLVRYIAAQTALLSKGEAFRDFVELHILWYRSTSAIYETTLPEGWWKLDPRWNALLRALGADVFEVNPAAYLLLLPILAALLFSRHLRRTVHGSGIRAQGRGCDTAKPTILALLASILLALPYPLLAWFLGWRLWAISELMDHAVYDLARAAAEGLLACGELWSLFALIVSVTRPGGLGECHFGWSPVTLNSIRRNVLPLAVAIIPATFLIAFGERYSVEAWRDSFGRFVFLGCMVVLAVSLYRIFRFRRGAFSKQLQHKKTGWLYTLRHLWLTLLVGTPLVFFVLSAAGYHFTSVGLATQCVWTVWLVLGLILLQALLIRWLLTAERRLAARHARKARIQTVAGKGQGSEPPPEVEILTIREQARTLVRALIVVLLAIGTWSIWSEVLPALGFLKGVQLWSYTDTVAPADGGATTAVHIITLDSLLIALLVAAIALILARNVPGLLEMTLISRLPLDNGGRFAIRSLSRYAIVVVGLFWAFGYLGVGWAKVQWLAAAVTVGLGFGLQEIFANFVSGLILLFERPIRIGDTVTIGGISGNVTRIRIRATTITDWDNKELVIPNKEFVTGQVINWTLSDKTLRLVLPVGIAYGSDTELAESVLLKVARNNNYVLSDPAPTALFMDFGDSTLNFELRAFVPNIDHYLRVRHELNKAIDLAFREAGIEIAFPQRDLHIRTMPQLPADRGSSAFSNQESSTRGKVD